MTQRITPGIGNEWLAAQLELPEPLEELTHTDHDGRYRLEADEASASLTDLQRFALRWLSSLD